MEGLETSQVNAETDDFSLIDVSASDDDFLLASSSEPNMVDNPGHIVKGVPTNQSSDSLDLQKPQKSGKCNLRKSLAWDSAFFTNAGVLDPEELSSIIEGVETGVKQNLVLPGIQEELSKSMDSTSSFQSDNVTLESLEADLFSDIRASIQKCSKSSTTENDHDSGTRGEDESKNASSKKIVEPSSSKLAKPKSATNKLNSGVPGSVRSVIKPPVNRSRDPGSLLSRPLKAASGPFTTMKRMSVDADRVKQDLEAAGNVKGKGASSTKTFYQVDSKKPLPKASAMSKVSATSSVPIRKPLAKASAVPKVSAASSVLTNRTATHSSRSSCDSSNSSASQDVQKSQAGVIRRKADKNGNLPSGKIRSLSKGAEKVKPQNNGCRFSAYVKSTVKVSSSISPSSSVSEWSIESSSSTATANQNQFGLSRCSPSSQVENNASQDLHNPSSDTALDVRDNQVPGTLGQSAKQPSTEGAASSRTNTRSGFAKPSGLRLPSPKIGFFDGAKAGAKTPSSSSRSRSALPTSLPRSVTGSISSSGPTNRTKLSPSASKMTKAAAGTAKPKQKMTDANPKTASPLPDHSAVLKIPSGVKHIDIDLETSDGPTSILPKSALESEKSVSEVPDAEKLSSSASRMTKAAAGTANSKQQIDANPETASPLLDNSSDLKNPSGVKHIGTDSETSDGPGSSPSGVKHIDTDLETSDGPTSILPKSALERKKIVSEVPDAEKLSSSASKMTKAAAGTANSKQQIDANPETASPLPNHSSDLKNPSGVKHIDTDSETSDGPRSIPSKSALERDKNVSEVPDPAKHVLVS